MAKQFGNAWLARDHFDEHFYLISKKRPVAQNRDRRSEIIWETKGSISLEIPSELFHKLTQTRLKPGEGPMRAQISIEL